MSSSSDSGEGMTHLESYSQGGFGTFGSGESQYNNDGTRSSSGFMYCPNDLYTLMASKEVKVVRSKYGGIKKIAAGLQTDLKNGICNEPSLAPRVAAFGENRLPEPPHPTWLELFLEAFEDVAVIILSVAAIIALAAGITEQVVLGNEEQGWIEGVAILIAVLIVATVTATNDYTKDQQFRALKKQSSDRKVRVIRDGEEQVISVFDIVVGDVVKLLRGDQIPADGLYVPGLEELMVDEMSLNGEAVPAAKNESKPFLWSGCFVTKGSAYMLVLAVGTNTEWGRTLALVPDEHDPTPLQDKLEELVILIGKIGMGVATVVFVILVIYYIVDSVHPTDIATCTNDPTNKTICNTTNQYNWSDPGQCTPLCSSGEPVEGEPDKIYLPAPWKPSSLMEVLSAFIIAVTIVVVAVPEGLPLAVTISLAYSVKQMYDDQNLVRHLEACEVMGGATNICSDKTGTLTEGKMHVASTWISGTSYPASGNNQLHSGSLPEELRTLFIEGLVLNIDDGELIKETGRPVRFLGNPTECALLVLSESLGASYKRIQSAYPPVKKWGFTSARKKMSTIVAKEGYYRLYSKGAGEIMLDLCSVYIADGGQHVEITKSLRKKLEEQIEEFAKQGLRTLTIAYRDYPRQGNWAENGDGKGFEEDLTLIAIVAIADPLRPEVPDSVLQCQRAGITVRMVTGDNALTARKIASDCYILTPDGVVLEGPEFERLNDDQIRKVLPKLQVLARSRPQDKLRLVQLLMGEDEVVAVTGDGTNDAPALSAASVGLAMGLNGTEVAKNAADIIILDDNFASIVKSVLWGRCVYDNIRKFLQFQLTVNVVALVVAFVGAVSNFGTPLTAIQLLWVNLIMDTMAALALGTEKPNPSLLLRKPYGKYGKLITMTMIRNIVGQSIFQLTVLFTILYAIGPDGYHLIFKGVPSGKDISIKGEPSVHYTMLFNTFVFCQVFNEISSRKVNQQLNVFEGMFTNWIFVGVIAFTVVTQFLLIQFGGVAVKTMPLDIIQWVWCVGIGFFSLPVGLLLRLIPVPLEFWEREDGGGEAPVRGSYERLD